MTAGHATLKLTKHTSVLEGKKIELKVGQLKGLHAVLILFSDYKIFSARGLIQFFA